MIIVPSPHEEYFLRLDMVLGCWKIEDEPLVDLSNNYLKLRIYLIGYSFWIGTIGQTSSSWVKLLFIPITMHCNLKEHCCYSVYLHGKAKENLVLFLKESKKELIETNFLKELTFSNTEIYAPIFKHKSPQSIYERNLVKYYSIRIKDSIQEVKKLLRHNSEFKINLQ